MDHDGITFCQNILTLRKSYNLSKKEMAKILGISNNKLVSIENGNLPKISSKVLLRINDHFKINPDTVLFKKITENNFHNKKL